MANRKYFKIEIMQKEDKTGFEVYTNGDRDFEREHIILAYFRDDAKEYFKS